ncbi:hypothetical protein C4J97_1084 [Pseudomonas orientalis]|nr:hypothetical protein C4J97_1084 [Pseudomonas orientalis]
MLAKNVNDNAGRLNTRAGFEFFASKLAPTAGAGVSYQPFAGPVPVADT